MPRHIRNNLMTGMQMILDRAWEFQELERLTVDEKKSFVNLRSELMQLKHRFAAVTEILEERGEFRIPDPIRNSMFSWAIHDAKVIAKRDRPKRKLTKEQLEKKLAKLQSKLEELQDESE